ncbi:MAG: hypothetical protein ACK502_01855 [Alphaproteobacteria bacterium]
MPPLLAIAIVILSVLLIAFGNDPMEEARIENEKKYKGEKDPLMRAIIDYNEEKVFGKSKGNGRLEGGVSKREAEKSYDVGKPSNSGRNSGFNEVEQPPRERGGRTSPDNNNLNNNNYYPPPATRDDSRGLMGAPTQPRSDGHLFLRGGERLAYSGTKVFYVDSFGKKRPLPDGKYRTANGLEMLIIGGEKTIASN